MRRWWRIGGEAVKPLEERMSGKSMSRSETHFGVERRAAHREEEVGWRRITKWQENLERSC